MTSNQRAFPVLGASDIPGCPKFVRWSALSEEWAQRNHRQSLARLAERGGLSPLELSANIKGHVLQWRHFSDSEVGRAITDLIPIEVANG